MRRADPIASPTLWVGVLFVALLFGMPQLAPLFQWSFPGVTPPVFERGSFFALWLSHAGLVLVAGGAATLTGLALAIFVTRPAGRDFRALVSTLAAVGQTFPPAAVLALAQVPFAVPAGCFRRGQSTVVRTARRAVRPPDVLSCVVSAWTCARCQPAWSRDGDDSHQLARDGHRASIAPRAATVAGRTPANAARAYGGATPSRRDRRSC